MPSEASSIEPTRISDITPTATPAPASRRDALLDAPRVRSGVLVLGVGVEDVAVRLQREPQAREVGEQQHDRDRERHLLDARSGSSSPPRRAAAARRRGRAGTSPAARARRSASSSIVACALAASATNLLALAPPAADQHRGAHDQQQVAEDRADDRGLDDLLQALLEREQRDDQLRRVAERDVQQAADARARRGARAPRSPGPSAPRSARRPAPTRRRSMIGSACEQVEHDRDRDERDEQVRPALPAEQEAPQVEGGLGLAHRCAEHTVPARESRVRLSSTSSSAHLRAFARSPLACSMQAAYLSTLFGVLAAVRRRRVAAAAEPSPSPRSARPAASTAFSSSPNGFAFSGAGNVCSCADLGEA